MFISCHPVLSREARVALTLRVVGGLTSDEIARAFLVPEPTVQARITRAKKTIAAAEVPFELPPADERRERLGGVLSVLYVIFTEGSTATSGDRLLRPDLAYEAIRLARMLAALLPDEPEVHGLLALFELTAARFPARTGPDGDAGAARGPGPAALGPRRRSAVGGPRWPAGDRPRPRRLRPAGRDRRVPRVGALGRGDRLGPDRAALRGARPGRALAGRRAQPGRRRRDGLGPGAGPGHRGRAGRLGPAPRFAPAPDRTRRAAHPPRPATARRAPSWSWPPGCAPTSASARCCCARRPRWADFSSSAGRDSSAARMPSIASAPTARRGGGSARVLTPPPLINTSETGEPSAAKVPSRARTTSSS